jgi:hypothetical protein
MYFTLLPSISFFLSLSSFFFYNFSFLFPLFIGGGIFQYLDQWGLGVVQGTTCLMSQLKEVLPHEVRLLGTARLHVHAVQRETGLA